MIKVKALAECSVCETAQEYWAVIGVDTVDESDTFSSRERPVINISLPEGWARSRYASRCHCGPCVDSMTDDQRNLLFRY